MSQNFIAGRLALSFEGRQKNKNDVSGFDMAGVRRQFPAFASGRPEVEKFGQQGENAEGLQTVPIKRFLA
jgi:hypothetical protein